jgi:dsDNA-specific endonuclease/ATPase MutS2
VLRASADACRLVVATSHYDEVKALAGGDGGDGGMVGAANAAVEFDAATLRPTYRLLWGASGESNALAIARGLGLDAGVADRAEKRWRRQRRAAGLRGDDDDGAGAATVTAVDDVSELASALERERASQEERAASAAAGASHTLVPIRPRWRGERRSLRTLPVVSLRPPPAFNPRPRRLSTPTDAFELHPDIVQR